MTVEQEHSDPAVPEPIQESMPRARLVLTVESWNEIVRLVEAPPEPTDELRRLFRDRR
jgi:uncharacterized protein (DUF1778 family)